MHVNIFGKVLPVETMQAAKTKNVLSRRKNSFCFSDVVMDPGTIHKKVEVSVYDKAFRESNVVAGNQRSHRVEQNANNEEFMVSSVVRVCNAE